MARAIDGDELLGIERLLDTDAIRKSKTASWLLDQVLHDIQAMPTIDPESLRPRWIPVEERLPDTDKDVLVYATAKFIGVSKMAIDKLEEGEQRPIWLYTHGWFEVTHWMPLPEPPEVSE